MTRLTVDLNGDGLHTIAAPSSFETAGPFDVWLRNHGEAVHVHCTLDDSLSAVARLPDSNHFVEANASHLISLETRPVSEPVTGRLKVVTGYGSKAAVTTVTVTPPDAGKKNVAVDEKLSVPKPRKPPEPSLLERIRSMNIWAPGGVSLSIILFGLIAIGLSVAVAISIESPVVLAGAVLVFIGVVAALAITRSS